MDITFRIKIPLIPTNNFTIKPTIFQIIPANKFGGFLTKDPNYHIASFLEIFNTFKYNGISDDAIRLKLFPFSLRDKVKS